MALTTMDMLEEFVAYVRDPDHDMADILKHYGGGTIYIPTYRSVMRDEELVADYRRLVDDEGKTTQEAVRELCRKYELSKNRVWELTRDIRNPTLF